MSLQDRIKTGETDVIEWTDDAPGIMAWRFSTPNNSITYGTRLHVHEFQLAVFRSSPNLSLIFKPGIYTLTPDTLPKLSLLQKESHNKSFKSDIFFSKTKYFLDEGWVLEKPITLRDSTFGLVRLNAFGTFDVRIVNVEKLIAKMGAAESFSTAEAGYQIGHMIQNLLPEAISQTTFSVLDPDNDYTDLTFLVQESLNIELHPSGLMIENLRININALRSEN